jgi:Zn-dependent metalloprotease
VVLLHFDQRPDALSRSVHDAQHGWTLPGTLVRAEGAAPTGDPDTDLAYDFLGDTYRYFWTELGRDGVDGAGGTLRATTHFGTDFANAFWNGVQMVFGDGFSAADDVVAHELTHGVTEPAQSLLHAIGGLERVVLDIFGEAVDLANGTGTDTPEVRWLLGSDVPGQPSET